MNDFPFIPIFKTGESLCFLSVATSIDIQPSHILVIPKKHFESFDEIPQEILNDLIRLVSLSCKVIKKYFPDYRIQLNNGEEAEQYIEHSHFHVFPMKNKKQVEFPELKEFTKENFEKFSEKLKEHFNSCKL